MTDTAKRTFTGFINETLTFFRDVHANNSKAWFEDHRDDYNRYVMTPFKQLVTDLAPTMLKIDPFMEVRPAVNKTISKIHRDTRFSNDKTLFKQNMWLTFKRPSEDWKVAPAFYFELFPDWYRYGMGYYSATRADMNRLREAIDNFPGEFLNVTAFLRETEFFTLHGDEYKRPIPSDHPDEIQTWYQRKSFYVSCDKQIEEVVFSAALVDELAERFLMMSSLYQYLMDLQ
ncbi:DUF2461 domain-containing protein [candidate division KSB1 bacterium]|nr:DUF2461 domain-containing protein [candidate division KSB1 bacterium]